MAIIHAMFDMRKEFEWKFKAKTYNKTKRISAFKVQLLYLESNETTKTNEFQIARELLFRCKHYFLLLGAKTQ